ncbi:MAG: hypothetical protein KI793_08555 [Rivularia sp. (in: Bacteria)]|nr:hypothetical protein [Rivularia sp. MS3]
MNFADVWNIVWQDTPFHKAIAGILILAIVIEFCTFLEYFYLKVRITSKGIQYLKKLQKGKKPKSTEKLNLWLREHLQFDNIGGQSKIDNKFILKKYPTVLARRTPRSHLRFVTTLCTSIGVLGTFYGIQQGLQNINLGDISNSQQLMTSSIELLGNMKTAFSTSLMGLGCGSLFTFIVFLTDWLRRQRRNGLRNKLDRLATFSTSETENQNLIQAINELKQNLGNQKSPSAEEIGEAVGRSIANEFTQLNQLTSQAIGKAVGKQIHSMILPGMSRIIEEQERIRELQENQGQRVLEQLIQDLRVEIIEPVAQRLDESAQLTQRASEAVENLHNELGGISKSLATSVQTIQKFQKDTLVELQNFANNLGQILTQFQTDTTGVLERTGEEINRAVEKSIQGMEAQRTAFEASANQAADTFRGIREELQSALQERAEVEQKMLQGLRNGIVEILRRTTTVFEQQNSNLEIVGNQTSQLMNDASNNLLATLTNINETLTQTRQTVQDDLTKFRKEYQANLNNFFKEQNNLLKETLGEQRDGLAEVVNNLNTAFQEEYTRRNELSNQVNRSMNQISEAATDINQLACAVGLNSSNSLVQQEKIASELHQMSRNLNQQVEGVKTQYGQLTNAFQQSLTDWKNHFSESQEEYFNQADSSMAKVCSSLLQTAKVLVAANDNRNNGNGSSYYG